MQNMPLLDMARFTSPNPLALICAKPEGRTTNIATVSWYTILSVDPPRIGFSLQKAHFSGEIIKQTKEAILTIPGASLARNVMECGATTGRDTDKVERFNIVMQNMEGSEIQIPAHSVVAVQCRLREVIDVGDHYFYICDAINALQADNPEETLFAWMGYAKIATVRQMMER